MIMPESPPAMMLPENWMVKSAPAAASERPHRAVSHGSTGPSTVVTNPVTINPAKRRGRPLTWGLPDWVIVRRPRRANY